MGIMEPMLDWPEMTGIVFLVLGFGLALFSQNWVILYLVMFVAGMAFGATYFRCRKKSAMTPAFVAFMFCIIGLLLGTLFAKIHIVVLMIVAGTIVGYVLHDKGIIHSI